MLQQTPLHSWHLDSGAKMVPFAGWDMPISYGRGALEEHRLVRRSAGIFDVSHMGQFVVSGPGALEYLQRLVTANLESVDAGQSTYALLCRQDGGVLDDLFLYNLDDRWLVVVNAANRQKDFDWFEMHLPPGSHIGEQPASERSGGRIDALSAASAPLDGPAVRLEDISDATAMLAFQGPHAIEVMDALTSGAAGRIPRFGAASLHLHGMRDREPATAGERETTAITVGRTGYTGEDGVELFVPAGLAHAVWTLILARCDELGVEAGPVGLAARDSLRFEPGFALYGHELTEEINPIEARLAWACDLEKEFIGRDALARAKDEGTERRLATIRMTDRGVPRQGFRVYKEGEDVGHVATGLYAPTADAYCANVFVPRALAKTGTDVDIEIRGQMKAAVVVKRPLYKPAYR